jgi:hypothetical protein
MRRIILALLLPLALFFPLPALAKCVPTSAVSAFLREAVSAGAAASHTMEPEAIASLVAAMQANTPGMPDGPPVVIALLLIKPGGESGSTIILSGASETCVILTGPTPSIVALWNKGTGQSVVAGQGA